MNRVRSNLVPKVARRWAAVVLALGAFAGRAVQALSGRPQPAGAGRSNTAPIAALCASAAAGLMLLPLEPAFLDALGFGAGWLNGLRAGLAGVTLMPLAAAAAGDPQTETPLAHGEGRFERDRLGSNQQPSVS